MAASIKGRPNPWWLALLGAGWIAFVGLDIAMEPRHRALDALPDIARGLLAILVLFGVTGVGVTRMLLPASLRRHEALWVLPVGACTTGLSLMVLGFLYVPFKFALVVVMLAGLGLSVWAVRRSGPPSLDTAAIGWPVVLGLGIVALMVTSMVMQIHVAAVTGDGSDAHLAAGAGNFLQHAYPTSTDSSLPVDRMPLLWKSKYPIYYALGAVAQVSGLQTWQVLTTLIAVLMAMAACGMFLVAREVLSAPYWVAVIAMVIAGFDRMVLATGLHPYHNQTWGYFAMPFTLVLSWALVRPGEPRGDRGRIAALMLIFLGIVALAYPLAAPIPGLPLLVFVVREFFRRRKAGERLPRVSDVYRGPKSLIWLIPAVFVLAVPLKGVWEKVRSATQLAVDPSYPLIGWAGDLRSFIPRNFFFNLPDVEWLGWVVLLIVLLAFWELYRQPRELGIGLGVLFVLSLGEAIAFRHRDYGFYFHFKILAFVAPLVLVLATVGVARLRRWGPLLLGVFVVATAIGARQAVDNAGLQMNRPMTKLQDWARDLPRDASVRLDMVGGDQLWTAYLLASRRTCSQHPFLDSDYPHVVYSPKADYALKLARTPRPLDAVGPPVRANNAYSLFRLAPGTDLCSKVQVSRVQQSQLP
jgi:hypothetical protein